MSDVPAESTYAVVYQFGKVASTSVVAMLNQCDDVTAVQSHFLGSHALSPLVSRLVDPTTDEYFYFHIHGQFVRNLEVTRRLNQLRGGKVPGERLLMISIAREPTEWFRSAFTQDITGLMPTLRTFAAGKGLADTLTEDVLIETTLPLIMAEFAGFLTAMGGVDRTLSAIKVPEFKADLNKGVWLTPALIELFFIFLRPFDWYEKHYEKLLGHKIREYEYKDGYWHKDQGPHSFAILTYETLQTSLASLASNVDLKIPETLPRENTSLNKPHAAALRTAFDRCDLDQMKTIFASSQYCEFFGYS